MKQKKSNGSQRDVTVVEGLVTEVANRRIKAELDGQTVSLPLPSAMMVQKNAVAVGDTVEVELAGRQQKLLRVLPRRNGFYRGNRRSVGEQILVAANADQVVVVVSADYLLNQCGFVESTMIAARRAGLKAYVYVSKLDAVSEQAQSVLRGKTAVYGEEAVFFGTLKQPDEKLIPALRGKTTVLVGDRGSGKSTLMLNTIQLLLGSAAPYRASSTSAAMLVRGPEQTVFIDTPGFRDFALENVTDGEADAAFPEIAEYAKSCAFADCSHTVEDNCAVSEAVREGRISRERLGAYQKLLGRVAAAAPKVDYRFNACTESFPCKNCGELITPENAGTKHRNHCPRCLCSLHVDNEPGDRASLCHGVMEPISVWVRKDGEWALIHRCRVCGTLSSNRIAADDNPMLLLSIAVRPLAKPAFPLSELDLGK